MKALNIVYLLMLLVLLGCRDIEIKEGRIPVQVLSSAKAIEGKYSGQWGDKPAEIEIHLEGDQPRFIYVDPMGHDPLGGDCHSSIGVLQKIELVKKNGIETLRAAEFSFDPNQCDHVQGRTIELEFIDDKRVEMRILNHTGHLLHCSFLHGNPCIHEAEYSYLKGLFAR